MSDTRDPMKCPRCETELGFVGTKSFHEGTKYGFLGDLGALPDVREDGEPDGWTAGPD